MAIEGRYWRREVNTVFERIKFAQITLGVNYQLPRWSLIIVRVATSSVCYFHEFMQWLCITSIGSLGYKMYILLTTSWHQLVPRLHVMSSTFNLYLDIHVQNTTYIRLFIRLNLQYIGLKKQSVPAPNSPRILKGEIMILVLEESCLR